MRKCEVKSEKGTRESLVPSKKKFGETAERVNVAASSVPAFVKRQAEQSRGEDSVISETSLSLPLPFPNP